MQLKSRKNTYIIIFLVDKIPFCTEKRWKKGNKIVKTLKEKKY